MPKGWQTYFDARKFGKNFGIIIKCSVGDCGAVPPTTYYDKKLRTNKKMSHYRRIRWMMVHIATHKPVTLGRYSKK